MNTGASFNRYVYANNNPYKYIDPDGREVKVVGDNDFKKKVSENITEIKSGNGGATLMKAAEAAPQVITIIESRNGANSTRAAANADTTPSDSTINFAPANKTGGKDANGSTDRPAFVGLAHEMGHAVAAAKGAQSFDKGDGKPRTTPPSEKQSLKAENEVRKDHTLPARVTYY